MRECNNFGTRIDKFFSCVLSASAGIQTADSAGTPELSEIPERPLRTLASLRWPYVPDESAYPDPLKRDDPKPLQLPQYEAIGRNNFSPSSVLFEAYVFHPQQHLQ